MKIGYKVDDGRVRWAFRWAPDKMARALDSGLDSAAMEMVEAAQTELRRNDSLAFSTLVMAIDYERPVLVKLRRTLLSENFHTPMGSSHCWLYAAV